MKYTKINNKVMHSMNIGRIGNLMSLGAALSKVLHRMKGECE